MMRLFYLFLERVHNKRISPQGPKQINRNKQQKKAAQTAKQILKGKKKTTKQIKVFNWPH